MSLDMPSAVVSSTAAENEEVGNKIIKEIISGLRS